MPHRHLGVHPKAVEEAAAAAEWYRERSSAVADAFLSELDRAMTQVAEAPIGGLNTFMVLAVSSYVDCPSRSSTESTHSRFKL